MPNGGEILLLLVLAVIILGPARMPEYAAKLAHAVRALRDLAEGAKTQIQQEMGPAFDDVNWAQLDPRQYDPRRIVRDALAVPPGGDTSSSPRVSTAEAAGMVPTKQPVEMSIGAETTDARRGRPRRAAHDPARPTPFDLEAT